MELLRVYLVLLGCTLAVAAERRGPRPLLPEMPSLEERRQNNNHRPFRPVVPRARVHRPAANTLQFTAVKGGQREPQPEFAGRVAVAAHPGVRIINGDKAVLGQFPWQVGILETVSGGKLWCGGSIISSHWVLTAAHCIDDEPDSYLISAGTTISEGSTEPSLQTRDTVQAFQHPEYNPYYIDNDIGLIQVATPFTFNSYVRPVRLPPYSFAADMMVGKQGTVSGWGKSKDTDTWITKDLMYIQNTIDDGSACYNYYGNAWIPNKICVRTPDEKSFCSGDSGGAFVYEEEPGSWTQIGIVSFGASKGCELRLPAAYTRLASFLEFVEDTTNIAIRD